MAIEFTSGRPDTRYAFNPGLAKEIREQSSTVSQLANERVLNRQDLDTGAPVDTFSLTNMRAPAYKSLMERFNEWVFGKPTTNVAAKGG